MITIPANTTEVVKNAMHDVSRTYSAYKAEMTALRRGQSTKEKVEQYETRWIAACDARESLK